MSAQLLNAELVRQLIEKKGLKMSWVVEQIGLKRTTGHYMLRDGLLPKDEDVRIRSLQKLATVLGVEVPQILLRLDGRSKRTA